MNYKTITTASNGAWCQDPHAGASGAPSGWKKMAAE